MNNTAVTLKFEESKFQTLEETLMNAKAKLSAISMIDLSGVGDNVSYGHHLLIDNVEDELSKISQMLKDSMV